MKTKLGATAAALRTIEGIADGFGGAAKLAGGALAFFFSSRRRHTRLVSDWSSDVCSSDLSMRHELDALRGEIAALGGLKDEVARVAGSEERRVGKECRSRWSPYH